VHGQRLRQLRKKAGLSQYKLALRAGLQPATVGYLEREEGTNPQLATLEALAEALGCTVSDLLAKPAEPEQVTG
jgi:transcriptional regulator with XRE-family HTH domain